MVFDGISMLLKVQTAEYLTKNMIKVLKEIENLLQIDLHAAYEEIPSLKEQHDDLFEYYYNRLVQDLKDRCEAVKYIKKSGMFIHKIKKLDYDFW